MNTDTKWIVGTGVAVIASVVASAVAVIAVMVTLVGGVREDALHDVLDVATPTASNGRCD